MISQTDRITIEIPALKRSDRNITATITIRITAPKSIDVDKASRKFVKKHVEKFKKHFKDFAKDINKDCEQLLDE